jgi:hypothetical protein
MIPHTRIPFRFGLVILGVAAWAASSHADGLDKVLTDNARGVLAHLSDKGYANIGVLKFEVQTGGPEGPVAMTLGRMNESMATRLENALILATDDEKPIGIIRGAGRIAAERNKSATYQTEEGRKKLFTGNYPLAWGGKTVTPNALLVGRVTLDKGWKKATVTLRLFDDRDPAEWQEVPLKAAEVGVTRQTLADLDQPFVVPQLVRKRGGEGELADPFRDDDADKAIVPIMVRRTQRPGEGRVPELKAEVIPPPVTPEHDPSGWGGVEELLDFHVYYDEKRIERDADGNLPPPKPGQKVHFTVKSTQKLGLVLLVNGINTADFDKANKEINGYVKWVLEPKQEYLIRGYYTDKRVYPFETAEWAVGEERLTDLAPRKHLGKIELHVYTPVERGAQMARNGGGLREMDGTAESLAELKSRIKERIASASKPVARSLIIPGAGEEHTGRTTDFVGVLAAKLVFTYSEKPALNKD